MAVLTGARLYKTAHQFSIYDGAREKKLSIAALSQTLPERLIEQTTP
jgi:hypothetical protein